MAAPLCVALLHETGQGPSGVREFVIATAQLLLQLGDLRSLILELRLGKAQALFERRVAFGEGGLVARQLRPRGLECRLVRRQCRAPLLQRRLGWGPTAVRLAQPKLGVLHSFWKADKPPSGCAPSREPLALLPC